MRMEVRLKRDLREWAYRPQAITGEDAARAILARLGVPAPPRRRASLRPALAMVAAALIAVVALYAALRGRGAHEPTTGTTAAITLSSGTQVVIDLREVKR